MIQINKKNGFIYIYGVNHEIDWCDHNEDPKGLIVNYFLLNCVTKEYFRKEFLEKIRNNEVLITQELFDEIRTFKQNPTNNEAIPSRNEIKTLLPNIELMEHQVDALELMLSHDQYGFFYGPGTGKTLIAITWLLQRKPNSCLIVTPQKVVGQYQSELNKYFPNNNYDVTNFEQLHKIVEIAKSSNKRTSKATVLKQYDAIIIDESHKVKNYTSDASIRLRELAKNAKYKYLFTGSPQDKSRHDILSQIAILDPRIMPSKTKTLERYFRIDDFYSPKHEIRERKHELTEVIRCYTIAKKTEDVIDLTKSHDYIIKCQHPTEMYDELLKNRVINTINCNGNALYDYECVADTPSLLRTSLKEICCGLLTVKHIQTQQSKWIQFNSSKTNELKSLVQTIPKGIIYFEFTLSIQEITNVLKSLNKSYVVVDGKTSAKKSTNMIQSFKSGQVDYLVIQSKSGNAGLDLTNVNTIIFYSLPDSFIVYEQCKHRIRRKGQVEDCNYYYLICTDTVEEKIYETLQKKKSFNDKVFSQLIKEK